jgi:DNA-binding response OmpR family regulator
VIEAHVSNLRRRLQAAAPNGEPVIQTLRGRGYRIAAGNEAATVWDE